MIYLGFTVLKAYSGHCVLSQASVYHLLLFRGDLSAMRAKWRKKRMRRLKRKRRKMRARSEKKNKTHTYPMKMMSNLPILFDTL